MDNRLIQPKLALFGSELLVNYMKRDGVIAHVKHTYGVADARWLLTAVANIDKALTNAHNNKGGGNATD